MPSPTFGPSRPIWWRAAAFPPERRRPSYVPTLRSLQQEIGARLILDTSRAMRYAPESGVYLMKPSERELSAMVGQPTDTRAEQIAAAQSLVRQGRSEVVIVSIGAEGALLVTDGLVEHFQAPDVPPCSAVGAGDSMVGAMVFALERGWSLQEAVRYGVAAGTATLMTPGTELCHVDDVEKLYRSTIEEPA